jgi:hypothetical protein
MTPDSLAQAIKDSVGDPTSGPIADALPTIVNGALAHAFPQTKPQPQAAEKKSATGDKPEETRLIKPSETR